MKAKNILTALLILISVSTFAQTNMPSSETVLDNAYAKAAKENKKVLLIFHASWCGWCKTMEASLADPTCKKFFDDNYVIATLDVMENKGKTDLENPGSLEVMKKMGGDRSGLPYWLILDEKGNQLANSLMPKHGAATGTAEDNVGCPASPKEVAYFTEVLKKTSKLKEADLTIIQARFLQNQPAPQPVKSTQ